MPIICDSCNKPATSSDALQCTECQLFIHLACLDSGVTSAVNGVRCSRCNEILTPILTPAYSATAEIMSRFEQMFTRLNAMDGNFSANLAKLNDTVAAQSQSIQACHSRMDALELENAELRERLADIEGGLHRVSTESVFREMNDRISRERSLVVFGIPENESIQDDADVVLPIFQAIINNPNAYTIQSARRIGRIRADTPRPVKVVLTSGEEVRLVLRNKNKIQKTRFRNVNIQRDLTAEQRQHIRSLRTELRDRKAKGERNITIRYIHSVPTIVTVPVEDKKRFREEEESPEKEKGAKMGRPSVSSLPVAGNSQ